MATPQRFLIVGSLLATTFVAAPAAARTTGSLSATRGSTLRVSGASIASPTLADARRLTEEGRYKDAQKAYRAIISQKREAGEYSADAMRGLAQVEFALGNLRATATALDDLADAAGHFGDPETQVTSLFQAALTDQDLKNREQVTEHLAKIRSRRKAAAISEETRRDVVSRIPRG